MQIPILNGIICSDAPELRTSYPRNMVPVPKDTNISKGYLRPADGILTFGTGPDVDRGAITWNGVHYRVMGNKLVSVSYVGDVNELGTIPGAGQVSLDYSFDRLIIVSGKRLYYWNGYVVTQVTDPDLGDVLDAIWIDGYTMVTDGTSLVVTDLTNPTSVNPLRYGSAEADPDPIKRVLELRGEACAVGRHTIEFFNNIGGPLFPFERNEGAQMQRGALGTHCATVFSYGQAEVIAFLGGGKKESPAVWVGANSITTKISTAEIDTILQEYTEQQLSQVLLESRIDKSHQLLYLHLPDQTLVFDGGASAVVGEMVWYPLTSSLTERGQYRARNIIWCHDRWLCGDTASGAIGQLTEMVSTHYGQTVGWEFTTSIVYNEGRGAIFNMLELVALPGRVPLGADPVVWTSYSLDGVEWSMERPCSAGKQGGRQRRLTWLCDGSMDNWRIQRFRGTSDAHLAVVRLEVQIEPLNV